MSLAIGGSSAPATPAHGTLWVDVRDFGAAADGMTDNSGPFQAAIDYLISQISGLVTTKGIVYIPSAPGGYLVGKSIWVDAHNIEIQGDGWGTCIFMTTYLRQPIFIFGIGRVQFGISNGTNISLQADATNRPDLFGKLDTSAVNAPGTRWGLRTNGNSFAQFHASPICAGVGSFENVQYSDLWGETTQLTVEFCIEPPTGQTFPLGAPLLGIGSIPVDPAPFCIAIWDTPTKVLVVFRTSDMDQEVLTTYGRTLASR